MSELDEAWGMEQAIGMLAKGSGGDGVPVSELRRIFCMNVASTAGLASDEFAEMMLKNIQ